MEAETKERIKNALIELGRDTKSGFGDLGDGISTTLKWLDEDLTNNKFTRREEPKIYLVAVERPREHNKIQLIEI